VIVNRGCLVWRVGLLAGVGRSVFGVVCLAYLFFVVVLMF
jgi:hypothetical protein